MATGEQTTEFLLLGDEPYRGEHDPLEFGAYATGDFMSLVRSFETEEERKAVEQRMLRKRESGEPLGETAEEAGGGDMEIIRIGFTGLRVLWVDDHPDTNKRLVNQLSENGALVELLTDAEEALAMLKGRGAGWFHVVVSSCGRGARPDAGFQVVEQMRSVFEGPVIFYTSRVTQARRERAHKLNAWGITSDPMELMRMLGQLVPPDVASKKAAGVEQMVRS